MTSRPTWAAPLAVLTVGTAFLVSLWAFFDSREDVAAQRQFRVLAEQVAARTENVVQARLRQLRHLRRHWLDEPAPTEARWSALAREELFEVGGFQALNWVDAGAAIRWVEPVEGNEAALGARLADHPVVGPLFRSDDWPEGGRISPPLQLMQGGRGVVSYLPVERERLGRGWVSGVFRLDDLMAECLPKGPPRGHGLKLIDEATGIELITLAESRADVRWEISASATLTAADRLWRLSVSPTAETAAAVHTAADEVFAVGGGLLLLLAAWLLWRMLERERELEESRGRYRSLVEGAPEAIVVLDVDTGRFIDANERACRMFGLDREHLLLTGPSALSPPRQPSGEPSATGATSRVLEALAGGEPAFEWVHRSADGTDIPCEIRLKRLGDPERKLVRGTMTDISARREAQRALRESEAKYRRIVDTAHEGVWVIDEEARTTFVNGRMAEILGGSVEEILGRFLFDFMDDEDRLLAERHFGSRRRGQDAVHEFRFRRLDGSHVRTLVSTNPLTDDDGRFVGALAMVADITSQKELEDQLRQSQKMEAIGRLAGGIAHDFNNVLTGILGAAELLEKECKDEPQREALAREIREAGERASGLTRQLLTFSRRQVLKPELVDLRDVVAGVDGVLQRLIGEEHRLEVQRCDQSLLVHADPAQLQQVVLNLVVNARDAAPQGGTIRLRLGPGPGGTRGMAVLEVEDEGTGVPSALRERIFEPFFTTKEELGTGLGLATVHGIVTQGGGMVSVSDSPSGGATFRVVLPLVEGALGALPSEPPRRRRLPGLEILLVEDEAAVRRVLRRMLGEEGHRVREAADGEEAWALFESAGSEFDLLLTDLVMPRLGGRELAERVRERRPDLPIVIMTGYSETQIAMSGGQRVEILPKPFRTDDLLSALARARALKRGR